MGHDVRHWSWAALFAWILSAVAPAWALSPDEIALVVNARVPEGRALAELYAQQRHIPAGRIIAIDLDPGSALSPAEEMPFDEYEPKVAAPVRAFLLQNDLKYRVKCLVTFWGMPLRIGGRQLSKEDGDEAARISTQSLDAQGAIADEIAELEHPGVQLDPSVQPKVGNDVRILARRLDLDLPVIVQHLPDFKAPAERATRFQQILSVVEQLIGHDRATILMAQPAAAKFAPHPVPRQDVAAARARVADVERQIAGLQSITATAADRAKAEALAKNNLGVFGYAFLLSSEEELLKTNESESALDSELSLLWWPAYPRARWVNNPLQWRIQVALRNRRVQQPTLMVTRLDGPAVSIVRDIILTSVKVESEGLHGQVAIDARGMVGQDPYSEYDDKLRQLAELVRHATNLQVTLENTDALIPAHSLRDIAIYCGWYSLRNFSSPGSFSPGAVGFHVASLELVSLRGRNERGWVRGLLSEGVVGTLGAVAEPYLQSFPPPDEFFPLLMTGRLTLAEVYWRTLPWASWMQTCIGDPLYNPYKTNPPMAVADLPKELKPALLSEESTPASTEPTTLPK